MLPRIAKVIISILLSALSVVLYLRLRGKERKSCMLAMLLCTVGDLFMVNLFGLGDVSTYPGAAFFMAGHVVYGLGFLKESNRKGYVFRNRGFWLGTGLVIAAAVLLGALAFTIPEEPQTLMYFLILIYLAVIGFNLACQFSYAHSEMGSRVWIAVGMALFLLSDLVIFLNMLAVTPAHNDFVWATYIPAQLLILLFCRALKRTDGAGKNA